MSGLWLMLFLIGGLTYLIRLSFIFLLDKWDPPQLFKRGLRFVPLAVLPALILPDLFIKENALAIPPDFPRLIAALAAGLVAWRTKSVLLTILVGIIIFYLIKLFLV
jgi:branched-subunit amino acid transport protein